MPKFTILIEPVNATPRNFPVNQLLKLHPALRNYLARDLSRMLVKDMEETVKNWNTKPDMVAEVTAPYGTRLQLTVQPKGKGTINWKRVSAGTGPRDIYAKTSKGMRFQRNYIPKTTPGGKYGGPGRKYGPWVRAMKVHHTIKPRQFSIKIMARREGKIRNDIQNIVRRVAKL